MKAFAWSIFLCIMRYAKLCASALKIAIKYSCFDLSRAKGERDLVIFHTRKRNETASLL